MAGKQRANMVEATFGCSYILKGSPQQVALHGLIWQIFAKCGEEVMHEFDCGFVNQASRSTSSYCKASSSSSYVSCKKSVSFSISLMW